MKKSTSKNLRPIDTAKAFDGIWLFWKITGIDRPKFIPKILYLYYTIILNCFSTILVPVTMTLNVLLEKKKILETLCLGVGNISLNLKFLNTFFEKSYLMEISELLKDLDQRIQNEEERDALEMFIRRAKLIFKSFVIIHGITWVVLVIRVVAVQEKVLLYPGYYFVNWQDSENLYRIILTYQISIAVIQCLQNCTVGTYPICYLFILTGHMKALELRIRTIGLKPFQTMAFYEAEIIQCIKDHKKALQLYELVQKVISRNGFILLSSVAFSVCASAFLFLSNSGENSFTGRATSIMILTIATSEVFMICYVGHMMETQIEDLFEVFYFTDWVDKNQSFKMTLLFALQRTNQPTGAFAGGYIPLNLVTFIKLMKTTYSVFTLFINLSEK